LEASRLSSISLPLRVSSLKEVSENATAEAEKQAILEALRTTRGNKTQAARLLKIDYKTLHVKIKRYGLQGSPGASTLAG
jgi:DNA-binding NtrC family response regulator